MMPQHIVSRQQLYLYTVLSVTNEASQTLDRLEVDVERSWQIFVLLVFAVSAPAATMPKTRTDNVTETVHGVQIKDPYRWLEDQNSPETRAWIGEQNAYMR